MKNFFRKVADFLIFTAIGLFYGFIGGLGISMAFYTMRHHYLWCAGVMCFFLIFHFDDLKNYKRDKDWLAFSGRLVTLFAMTSFIISVIIFGIGAINALDLLDIGAFIIFIPLTMAISSFWMILSRFGQNTRLYLKIDKTIKGLHVVGVFWK